MSDKNKEIKVSFRITRELSDKIKERGNRSKVIRAVLEKHFLGKVTIMKPKPIEDSGDDHLNSSDRKVLDMIR